MSVKFSIIIPTLNSQKYLKYCLKSISKQTYKNFEVIIVDGGSKDKTLKIIKECKIDIKVFIKKNLGQSEAINYGIKKSKGNWITWQNSDDYYFDKNVFMNFKRNILLNKKIRIFVGNINLVNEHNKILRDVKYTKPSFYSLLYEDMTLTNQACFWDRNVHKKIGYLKKTKINFDYEFFLKFLKRFPKNGYHINRTMGCFRLHKNQKTQNQSNIDILKKIKIKKKYGYNDNLSFFFKMILYARRSTYYLFQGNIFYLIRGFFKFFLGKKNIEYINS